MIFSQTSIAALILINYIQKNEQNCIEKIYQRIHQKIETHPSKLILDTQPH